MPALVTYPGVYLAEGPPGRPIPGVPTSTAAFLGASALGPVEVPTALRSFADFERTFGGLAPGMALGPAVRQFFDNGGRDAVVVRTTAPTLDRALASLEAAAFNLLCLPPLQDGVDLPAATRAAAAALCRRRRALFIVDPSHAWNNAADAAAGLDAFFPQRGSESALYFPFLRGADPFAAGQTRTFAPCGTIAGLMARLDGDRGVWKAPAGTDAALRGGLTPALALGNADSEILNPLGINAVRSFPRIGTVPWGARTLAPAGGPESDYRYVSVRRFANFIEESVSAGLRDVVFEPNAETTWARVRDAVGSFLHDLFRQGAITGRSPHESYFVNCGSQTTTADDIAKGRLNLEVGFAPLRPAEFLVLRFGLAMTGSDP